MREFNFFFFKQKTAYEIRKGDWSSDVCSSDLDGGVREEWTRNDPESGREVTKFSSSRANVDQIDLRWWFDEVDEDGQVTRWQRATTLHYLYRREAELLFAAAGFDLDALHGDYDGSPAGGA